MFYFKSYQTVPKNDKISEIIILDGITVGKASEPFTAEGVVYIDEREYRCIVPELQDNPQDTQQDDTELIQLELKDAKERQLIQMGAQAEIAEALHENTITLFSALADISERIDELA